MYIAHKFSANNSLERNRSAPAQFGVSHLKEHVAVAAFRCAKTNQVFAGQFAFRRLNLSGLRQQPLAIFCNHFFPVSVLAYDKWITPFAWTSNVDGSSRDSIFVFVQNLWHIQSPVANPALVRTGLTARRTALLGGGGFPQPVVRQTYGVASGFAPPVFYPNIPPCTVRNAS